MRPVLTAVEGLDEISSLRARADRIERLLDDAVGAFKKLRVAMARLANQPSMEPPALLSVDEAARSLGVSRTTAFQLVREGQLVSIKVGSRRLVPRSALQAFVDAHLDAS